jgi:uncharacterized Zn-binding protein involved in type VI secretion
MGQPAAVMGDNVLQDAPHCHAPMHPPAPTPTPQPHPPMPLAITINTSTNVLIGSKPAAVASPIPGQGSQTVLCSIPVCIPGAPGQIIKGSMTVQINGKPAARVGDTTSHAPPYGACVGPIPGPTGKILPPGVPTVMIG